MVIRRLSHHINHHVILCSAVSVQGGVAMRIMRCAILAAGLCLSVLPAAADAAIQISVATPTEPACAADRIDCLAAAAPAASAEADVPPAAAAGLVGLFALAFAFRPRKPGLPEVSS
jgi:hypothetical protein